MSEESIDIDSHPRPKTVGAIVSYLITYPLLVIAAFLERDWEMLIKFILSLPLLAVLLAVAFGVAYALSVLVVTFLMAVPVEGFVLFLMAATLMYGTMSLTRLTRIQNEINQLRAKNDE